MKMRTLTLVWLATLSVSAQTYIVDISATLSLLSRPAANPLGNISTAYEFTTRYSTGLLSDSDPSLTSGLYAGRYPAIENVTFKFQNSWIDWSFGTADPSNRITVVNDTSDSLTITTIPTNGYDTWWNFQLSLTDSSGRVFLSDQLPTTTFHLADFDSVGGARFSIVDLNERYAPYLFDVTALTVGVTPLAIPEAADYASYFAGLVLVAVMSFRIMKRARSGSVLTAVEISAQ